MPDKKKFEPDEELEKQAVKKYSLIYKELSEENLKLLEEMMETAKETSQHYCNSTW